MPKNENKTEEMISIMEELHQYVPDASTSNFTQVPFAGDQLTAARAREALAIRINSKNSAASLRGLVPFSVDWHAKVNYISVSLHLLYIFLCFKSSSKNVQMWFSADHKYIYCIHFTDYVEAIVQTWIEQRGWDS